MNSNLFWCIIGIIGGALVSLLYFLLGLERKILKVSLDSFELNINNKKYYFSDIQICNKGNTIIDKNDFNPLSPFSFAFRDENGNILCKENIIENNQKWKYKFSISRDDICRSSFLKEIHLIYDYFSKKDVIHLYIFHTSILFIIGELKQGKIIYKNFNLYNLHNKKNIMQNIIENSHIIDEYGLINNTNNLINEYITKKRYEKYLK